MEDFTEIMDVPFSLSGKQDEVQAQITATQ
jgi:hypothetical protein